MLDLHCHILPGVDDGPATLGETKRRSTPAALTGVGAEAGIAALPCATAAFCEARTTRDCAVPIFAAFLLLLAFGMPYITFLVQMFLAPTHFAA